jgi:hypothetical protein
MFSKKTTYTFTDENNKRSSITINKFDADILQETENDMHILIQEYYDVIINTTPYLSRIKRGNLVRLYVSKKAEKQNIYYEKLHEYL